LISIGFVRENDKGRCWLEWVCERRRSKGSVEVRDKVIGFEIEATKNPRRDGVLILVALEKVLICGIKEFKRVSIITAKIKLE
ncbi:unnamed protein product, partial [Dovyalis caffra]